MGRHIFLKFLTPAKELCQKNERLVSNRASVFIVILSISPHLSEVVPCTCMRPLQNKKTMEQSFS